jgi:hypothetical protein
MRRGRDRAGDRLAVDVAEVLEGQPPGRELVVQLPQRDAGLDGDGAGLDVDLEHPVEPPEPQEPSVGARDVGERVPGPDDLHGLPGGRSPADGFDHLQLAGGILDRRRRAVLVPPPVAPAVRTHRGGAYRWSGPAAASATRNQAQPRRRS